MRPIDAMSIAAAATRKDLLSLLGQPWVEPGGQRSERKSIRRAQARGSEGEVHFYLQRVAGGLYVERDEVPRCGARTSQSLIFEDRRSFERWCGDDSVRFRYPVLHAQLKRDADALWALEA